jgi:hypothetical protein
MKTMFPIALAACLIANTAAADAIDGNWCQASGRHMNINGSQILTPHGKRLQGNYDRHAFSYVAPAGAPAAGKEISMSLVDDDTMLVTTGVGSNKPVEWRRCIAPTS